MQFHFRLIKTYSSIKCICLLKFYYCVEQIVSCYQKTFQCAPKLLIKTNSYQFNQKQLLYFNCFYLLKVFIFFSIFQIQIFGKLGTRGIKKKSLEQLFDIQRSFFLPQTLKSIIKQRKEKISWAGEMVHQLRAFSGLLEDT